MTADLAALRHEFAAEVVGPLILEEVRRACRSQAKRYDPNVYARASRWGEEEIDELCQDVTTIRLLGEEQLAYMFDVAAEIGHWEALLVRQVRLTLARRRVRTVVDNLLDRIRSRLTDCDWVEAATDASGQTVFRFAGSGRPYRELSDRQVRELAEQVRIVPRRFPERGDRAPSVYSRRGLDAVLRVVLEGAVGGVKSSDLGRILRSALTDWIPGVLELNDAVMQRQATEPTPEELTTLRDIAKGIVLTLSSGEADMIRGRLAGLPDVDIATRLGISRPTLIRRREALFGRLRAAAANLSDNAKEACVDEIVLLLTEAGDQRERTGIDE